MLRDELLSLLDNLREFERTFEQKYRRKMNAEEVHLLQAAREIIKQQLAAENLKEDVA